MRMYINHAPGAPTQSTFLFVTTRDGVLHGRSDATGARRGRAGLEETQGLLCVFHRRERHAAWHQRRTPGAGRGAATD